MTDAATVPSTFAINRVFTLKTLPLDPEFVTIAAGLVPIAWTAVLPVIVPTETMFGAAIFYPKTIAIAIDFPVVMPPPLD